MYEDSHYPPPVLRVRLTFARGLCLLYSALYGGFLAFLFLAFCAFSCLVFGGCSAPGDYFGDKPAVAAANARPGGFGGVTASAPAIVAGAVKSAGWLNGLGAVALLAGCVILSQRDLNNGLGFGLALGGLALLLAGFLLPVYGGWIGLALVGALLAHFWGRARVPAPNGAGGDYSAPPGLAARLKSLFA